MQDKAFDQLLRDKFEEAEIQPSADLWNGISEQLSPKPKRSLPVYWMAAAVAVIVVTIGLLMPMQKNRKDQVAGARGGKQRCYSGSGSYCC